MSVYTKSAEKSQEIIDLENEMIKEMNNLYECLQDPGSSACAENRTHLQEIQNMINNSDFLTNDQYQAENENIMKQWYQILQLRAELDMKLRELYKMNASVGNAYKTYVDTTVYTNVLWTVLATSVVYFLFLKL